MLFQFRKHSRPTYNNHFDLRLFFKLLAVIQAVSMLYSFKGTARGLSCSAGSQLRVDPKAGRGFENCVPRVMLDVTSLLEDY
jgi:hypothetical protein